MSDTLLTRGALLSSAALASFILAAPLFMAPLRPGNSPGWGEGVHLELIDAREEENDDPDTA
jgi:hypothetical protein